MTHTLNRTGLKSSDAGEEIVVLCMVQRKEKEEKAAAMKRVARTVLDHGPDNFIGAPLGFGEDDVVALSPQIGVVTAVFTDEEKVSALLAALAKLDLGISVVLSGLFTDVRRLCAQNELTEHTFHTSLGIFGKTDRLPDEKVLEITTQCGHSLISPQLVRHLVRKIRKGKTTLAEAARVLLKPCACGIMNPRRIESILDQIVEDHPAEI